MIFADGGISFSFALCFLPSYLPINLQQLFYDSFCSFSIPHWNFLGLFPLAAKEFFHCWCDGFWIGAIFTKLGRAPAMIVMFIIFNSSPSIALGQIYSHHF